MWCKTVFYAVIHSPLEKCITTVLQYRISRLDFAKLKHTSHTEHLLEGIEHLCIYVYKKGTKHFTEVMSQIKCN